MNVQRLATHCLELLNAKRFKELPEDLYDLIITIKRTGHGNAIQLVSMSLTAIAVSNDEMIPTTSVSSYDALLEDIRMSTLLILEGICEPQARQPITPASAAAPTASAAAPTASAAIDDSYDEEDRVCTRPSVRR